MTQITKNNLSNFSENRADCFGEKSFKLAYLHRNNRAIDVKYVKYICEICPPPPPPPHLSHIHDFCDYIMPLISSDTKLKQLLIILSYVSRFPPRSNFPQFDRFHISNSRFPSE